MSTTTNAQVSSPDANGPVIAHPVQRCFDKEPASIAEVDLPTLYVGTEPSPILTAILTQFGARKFSSCSAKELRTILNELASNASTVINGIEYTIPSFADIAYKVKASVPKPALVEHLDLWLVALELHSIEDFGDIGTADEPLSREAYAATLYVRLDNQLDTYAQTITAFNPLLYIAKAFVKASSIDQKYDHKFISNVVWNQAHLFECDVLDTTGARNRLAHTIGRIICNYAAEMEFPIPSEPQLSAWLPRWKNIRALEQLIPLRSEDGQVDMEKVREIFRSLLLLQLTSPPATPERVDSDDEASSSGPALRDPFDSPELPPSGYSTSMPLPAPSDLNRSRNCRPLEEEPRSLALIAVLRLAALGHKDDANAHLERLKNYYFSEIANAEAYVFMLEMKIDKAKAETVAAVCKLTFDLERCPHSDAPQTKAQLQINLCPGTIFEGYNVIHKQSVVELQAERLVAKRQVAQRAADVDDARTAMEEQLKEPCTNPECNNCRCLSTERDGGTPLLRKDVNGNPTYVHDYCSRVCLVSHMVKIRVDKETNKIAAFNTPSAVAASASPTPFPLPNEPPVAIVQQTALGPNSFTTPPRFGTNAPRRTKEQLDSDGMSTLIGLPGSFKVNPDPLKPHQFITVRAKLQFAESGPHGHTATFVSKSGLIIPKIDTTRATQAFLHLRSGLATPDSLEGDCELVKLYDLEDTSPSATPSPTRASPTNPNLTNPVLARTTWSPSKEQFLINAQASQLYVQQPASSATSVLDPFAWPSAAGLGKLYELCNSSDGRSQIADLIDQDIFAALEVKNEDMGASPPVKAILDLIIDLKVASLTVFNKAVALSSLLDVSDEVQLKVKDGVFKEVTTTKTKYHRVSNIAELVFSMETISRCLQAFYNPVIIKRRFTEIIAKMQDLFRQTTQMQVVIKYVDCVLKNLRHNRNEIIRSAAKDNAHVGNRLADDSVWKMAIPQQWSLYESQGHLLNLMRRADAASIAKVNASEGALRQRFDALERAFKNSQSSKPSKQPKDTKRTAAPAPKTPAKRPKTTSPNQDSFSTSYGRILVTQQALANLLSSKLQVDVTAKNPNVWLAKAKDAWIALPENKGLCFTHNFLKSNNVIAACRFGKNCRAEDHG